MGAVRLLFQLKRKAQEERAAKVKEFCGGTLGPPDLCRQRATLSLPSSPSLALPLSLSLTHHAIQEVYRSWLCI